MQNEIVKSFSSERFGNVRVVEREQEPWFVAMDVCRMLGIKNNRSACGRLDEDNRDVIKYPNEKVGHRGGPQSSIVVNEWGLFHLIDTAIKAPYRDRVELIEWLQSLGFLKNVDIRSRKEIEFGDKLTDSLVPFGLNLSKQYPCLNYSIDFYIPSLNIAIEYDEDGHKNYSYEAHELRQERIEDCLGCRFIRVSDEHSDEYNIGYIIKQIFKL